MWRRGTRCLLLATVALDATALAAQDQPRTPDTSWTIELRQSGGPGGDLVARYQLLTLRRARLGVTVNLLARSTDSIGALVTAVLPNGPAARAGLHSGDVIVSFAGRSLPDPATMNSGDVSAPGLRLLERVAAVRPGDTVAVVVRRGSATRNISMVAEAEPAPNPGDTPDAFGYTFRTADPVTEEALRRSAQRAEGALVGAGGLIKLDSVRYASPMRLPPPMFMLGTSLADLQLAPMNPALGRYFGVGDGVLVINVPRDSRLGLKPGDVVLAVDGRELSGPSHLIRVLQSYQGREPFSLKIVRMKKPRVITGQVAE